MQSSLAAGAMLREDELEARGEELHDWSDEFTAHAAAFSVLDVAI